MKTEVVVFQRKDKNNRKFVILVLERKYNVNAPLVNFFLKFSIFKEETGNYTGKMNYLTKSLFKNSIVGLQ